MWNPSLRSPIAEVTSLISNGARPGQPLRNAAEMQQQEPGHLSLQVPSCFGGGSCSEKVH